jgi:hypothetical protein
MGQIVMTVIITRYRENIDWVDSLPCGVQIYNKGLPDIKQKFTSVPNFGRDTGTVLHHIVNNYNSLDTQTVFLQADPFDHCWDVLDLIRKNPDPDQVVWLGSNWGPVTKDFTGGPGAGESLPMLEVCYKLFGNWGYNTTTQFVFSAGSQYIVPRKFIVSKSLDWWIHAQTIFNQYTKIVDNRETLTACCVFERLWPLIWNYSTPDDL